MAATATAAVPLGASAGVTSLKESLTGVEPGLVQVITAIADSVQEIAEALRTIEFEQAGTTNSFGDEQLQADLHSDAVIFRHLRNCPSVSSASSEEQADIIPLGNGQYTVAFDPLDGSSIVGANFAVGSIFGIWKGNTPIKQTGRDQVAAVYSIYGPRTLLVVAIANSGSAAPVEAAAADGTCTANSSSATPLGVMQYSCSSGQWHLLKQDASKLKSKSTVAPANLRAAAENVAYKKLIDTWITSGCKLRYSGGMVPDVHHILAKGGGVFCNPKSSTAPAKLRLLYECAPLAFVVEAAGGMSSNGHVSILDMDITDTSLTTEIALGSIQQVEQCLKALQEGGQ